MSRFSASDWIEEEEEPPTIQKDIIIFAHEKLTYALMHDGKEYFLQERGISEDGIYVSNRIPLDTFIDTIKIDYPSEYDKVMRELVHCGVITE